MNPAQPALANALPVNSRWLYRYRLWCAGAIALAAHLAIFFSGKPAVISGVEFGMDAPPASVEVDLVESAPPAPEEPMPEPPQPDPPKPEPEPIPEPPKPEPKPEPEAIPEPAKPEAKPEPKPTPKPTIRPVEKKQQTSPRPTAISGAKPAAGTTGSTTGSQGGATSGPGHLFNPKPAYPAESRAAGERGTVLLSVSVEPSGRPGSISISKSSGFLRLDRAAQEAVKRWRFKPAMRNGVPYTANVIVPIRFELPK